MYKRASRFRQSLARRGKKPTSRNLVATDSAPVKGKPRGKLHKRLDQAAAEGLAAEKARYLEGDCAPRAAKTPRPRSVSN